MRKIHSLARGTIHNVITGAHRYGNEKLVENIQISQVFLPI